MFGILAFGFSAGNRARHRARAGHGATNLHDVHRQQRGFACERGQLGYIDNPTVRRRPEAHDCHPNKKSAQPRPTLIGLKPAADIALPHRNTKKREPKGQWNELRGMSVIELRNTKYALPPDWP